MAGHVNMMDDVLVSNLPAAILRSSLRLLISQGAATQVPFVQHVRERLMEAAPEFTAPAKLFPAGSGDASQDLKDYMALTRCLFSCKLVTEALPYLSHICRSVISAKATWTQGSSLESALVTAGGDIVQAIQAAKEVDLGPTNNLEASLGDLLLSLQECRKYCETSRASFPFSRAERQVQDLLITLYPHKAGMVQPAATEPALEVNLKDKSAVETFQLGPLCMPRLFNGLWQLSSPAWGSGTSEMQTKSLLELVEAGLTAADMADHYGDAELVYGDFRNRLPKTVQPDVICATKWCVFKPLEGPITSELVLDRVNERSRRVGGKIELLQFHWDDYSKKGYLDVLAELVRLSKAKPELVSAIGLCNFDTEHVVEVCEHLIRTVGEVGIVSNQVQFSLFDSRPLQKMISACEKYGLKLLTYGSFCGGMLASKWLGQPQPEVYATKDVLTPSQRKYIDVIHAWSSWSDFQLLLGVLADVARTHNVSLTNVATRWVLQQKAVGAVIVGTRLGVSNRWEENLRVFGWTLNDEEMARIDALALGPDSEKSRKMMEMLGDCGNEYRGIH